MHRDFAEATQKPARSRSYLEEIQFAGMLASLPEQRVASDQNFTRGAPLHAFPCNAFPAEFL